MLEIPLPLIVVLTDCILRWVMSQNTKWLPFWKHLDCTLFAFFMRLYWYWLVICFWTYWSYICRCTSKDCLQPISLTSYTFYGYSQINKKRWRGGGENLRFWTHQKVHTTLLIQNYWPGSLLEQYSCYVPMLTSFFEVFSPKHAT